MSKEEKKEYQRLYYLKNKDRLLEKNKSHYLENKDNYKLYYLKNKNELAEKCKSYYLKNKEKYSAQKRKYNNENENKDKVKKYRKENRVILAESYKKYINNNPSAKIAHRLRGRIYNALRGSPKHYKLYQVLGCNKEELKFHLENQFQKGMSWENYSFYGWHIDHIRPCASFDLADPNQQKQCFHYTNLQPLWAKDNWTKHAKY